jgi:hypothetical protein
LGRRRRRCRLELIDGDALYSRAVVEYSMLVRPRRYDGIEIGLAEDCMNARQ